MFILPLPSPFPPEKGNGWLELEKSGLFSPLAKVFFFFSPSPFSCLLPRKDDRNVLPTKTEVGERKGRRGREGQKVSCHFFPLSLFPFAWLLQRQTLFSFVGRRECGTERASSRVKRVFLFPANSAPLTTTICWGLGAGEGTLLKRGKEEKLRKKGKFFCHEVQCAEDASIILTFFPYHLRYFSIF